MVAHLPSKCETLTPVTTHTHTHTHREIATFKAGWGAEGEKIK
jgi:hypothetical protein